MNLQGFLREFLPISDLSLIWVLFQATLFVEVNIGIRYDLAILNYNLEEVDVRIEPYITSADKN